MRIIEPGILGYRESLELQRSIHKEVREGRGEETLILLRHPPVITLGRSAKRKNILVSEEIIKKLGVEIYEVERGGDVTFHGPGQWVGYPIIDLRKRGKDIHLYLRNLEEVIIKVLSHFGLAGKRIPGLTGVWVGEKKIASIGIAVRGWVTYHGFSFCIKPEKEYFSLINPCGLGKEMTSLEEELGKKIDMEKVKEVIKEKFLNIFQS